MINQIKKGNPKWVRQGQGTKIYGDFHWEYKKNGKYYAEGFYHTAQEAHEECIKHQKLQQIINNKQLPGITYELFDKLTPKEQKIIKLRFGLDGVDKHTLEETSKIFDVTRERIRQIEAKALRKLEYPSQSDSIR